MTPPIATYNTICSDHTSDNNERMLCIPELVQARTVAWAKWAIAPQFLWAFPILSGEN